MRRASRGLALPAALIALFSIAPAAVQAQFGNKEQTTIIPTAEFLAQSSGIGYFNEGFTYLQVDSSPGLNPGVFLADPHVPVGGVVTQVCAFVRDDDPAGNVQVELSVIELGDASGGPSLVPLGSASTGGAATPHYDLLCFTPPAGTTIRAVGDPDGDATSRYLQYRIAVTLLVSNKLAFGGALVKWHRQLSPAPLTATFSDVPTDFLFFRAIEALGASGITSGCATPGQFCPNANVTRGEIAAFLAKALGLNFPQ